jgi:phosphate transport system ATP-binding protein
MPQGARVSDRPWYFAVAEGQDETDHRIGILVEYDVTDKVFTNPSDSRTEAYVTGRFG